MAEDREMYRHHELMRELARLRGELEEVKGMTRLIMEMASHPMYTYHQFEAAMPDTRHTRHMNDDWDEARRRDSARSQEFIMPDYVTGIMGTKTKKDNGWDK